MVDTKSYARDLGSLHVDLEDTSSNMFVVCAFLPNKSECVRHRYSDFFLCVPRVVRPERCELLISSMRMRNECLSRADVTWFLPSKSQDCDFHSKSSSLSICRMLRWP